MKEYSMRANMYEIQALLYWILGELILHLGSFVWVGWLCIGYGFFTFISAIVVVIAGAVKEKLESKN